MTSLTLDLDPAAARGAARPRRDGARSGGRCSSRGATTSPPEARSAAGSRSSAWPDADVTGSDSAALLRGSACAVLISPPEEGRRP
jgi:hypothetical protein